MAFHPYPQLIRAVFNRHRCGPPRGVTPASSWPWVDHSASGLPPWTNSPNLRLAFATAPDLRSLTSPKRTTPRIIMQKARSQGPQTRRSVASPLLPLVGIQFQVLFHPASAVLFTFPSRYLSTIGHRHVFSLGRRSSQVQPGFHVSRLTQERRHAPCQTFRLRGFHPLRLSFPTRFG